MRIFSHKKFDKAFAKLTAEQRNTVKQAIAVFETNRLEAHLRDHALKGRLLGLRAFSAAWDLRVIYREEGGFITILLLDVGTHNQVY
ncbi:MAG: type II toxin-antitoxin system mRNA interferase toxin, RelE/StbE family [Luteolibacter sp.]